MTIPSSVGCCAIPCMLFLPLHYVIMVKIQLVLALLPVSPHEYWIIVNTDNATSQQVLLAERGRDPTLCACARRTWLLLALYRFELVIEHKAGADLVLAETEGIPQRFTITGVKKWLGHVIWWRFFQVLTLYVLDFILEKHAVRKIFMFFALYLRGYSISHHHRLMDTYRCALVHGTWCSIASHVNLYLQFCHRHSVNVFGPTVYDLCFCCLSVIG